MVLLAISNKDEKSWASLYEYYYAALCSYVTRILENSDHAEDIVQDIFVSLWNSEKTFSNIKEPTAYLYKSCYNNALIYLRNNKTRKNILDTLGKELESVEEDYYIATIREEVIRQLYTHIKALPAEQKQVIMLRIEGYSWNVISEMLNISLNTVKTHRARGLKFLREKLKNTPYIFLLYFL